MTKKTQEALVSHIVFLRDQLSRLAEVVDLLLEETTKLEQTAVGGKSRGKVTQQAQRILADELFTPTFWVVVSTRSLATALNRAAKAKGIILHTTTLKDGSGGILVTNVGQKGVWTDAEEKD